MLMERHGKNVSFTFLVCANLACKAFWMSILYCVHCHFQVRFEIYLFIYFLINKRNNKDLKFFSVQFSGTNQRIIAVHFHCFQAFYASNSLSLIEIFLGAGVAVELDECCVMFSSLFLFISIVELLKLN
jgi:hypothetical protein